jgi:hypothetical protein
LVQVGQGMREIEQFHGPANSYECDPPLRF